jgi:hypothetical protein
LNGPEIRIAKSKSLSATDWSDMIFEVIFLREFWFGDQMIELHEAARSEIILKKGWREEDGCGGRTGGGEHTIAAIQVAFFVLEKLVASGL